VPDDVMKGYIYTYIYIYIYIYSKLTGVYGDGAPAAMAVSDDIVSEPLILFRRP
jgi:hypothetical protein